MNNKNIETTLGLACIAKQKEKETLKNIFTNYASPFNKSFCGVFHFSSHHCVNHCTPCDRKTEADT